MGQCPLPTVCRQWPESAHGCMCVCLCVEMFCFVLVPAEVCGSMAMWTRTRRTASEAGLGREGWAPGGASEPAEALRPFQPALARNLADEQCDRNDALHLPAGACPVYLK